MSLTDNDLNKLLEIATTAILAAGKIIAQYQGQVIETELKKGGTSLASKVVTEVDSKAENAILDILTPTLKTYDLGLLSEETTDDKSRFEKPYFWCIDPLDGTLPFTQNQEGYSASIALVTKEGEAVIGIVYDPRNDNLYSAIKSKGAFKNGQPFDVENKKQNKEVTIINGAGGAVMQAIASLELTPCLFYKRPKQDEGGGCLWDYAASSVIHTEAGGVNSDYSFKPLNLNSSETVFMNKHGIIYSAGLSEKSVKLLLTQNNQQ